MSENCKINDCQQRLLVAERDAWQETAAQHLRNEEYYRGLVIKIGEMFGHEAHVANDGSVWDEVLCAKVPDLVARSRVQLEHYEWGRKNTQLEMDEREAEIEKLRSQLVSAKKALEDINGAAVCNVLADPDEMFQLLQHCAEVSDKALGDQSSAVESLANSQGGTGSTPVGRAQTDELRNSDPEARWEGWPEPPKGQS